MTDPLARLQALVDAAAGPHPSEWHEEMRHRQLQRVTAAAFPALIAVARAASAHTYGRYNCARPQPHPRRLDLQDCEPCGQCWQCGIHAALARLDEVLGE